MKFFYGQTRSDASLRFISGLPIQNSKLLTRIESWGPNPSTTTMLKAYWLGYDTGPVSKRPRLTTVKECDGGSPSVCMQPTLFSYEAGSNEYLDITDPTVATPAMDGLTPFTVADINGDGKHDIIYRTTNNNGTLGYYHYRLSNLGPESAHNTSNPAPFTAPTRAGMGDSDGTHTSGNLETFDLDGDGRSEWSFFRSPGISTGTVGLVGSRDTWRFNGDFALLPEPTGLGQSESYANLLMIPLYVSDLDGDGLPDTVESGPSPDINAPGAVAKYRRLVLRRNNAGSLGARQTLSTTSVSGTVTTYTVQVRPPWGSTDPSTPYGYNSYAADIDGSGRQALMVQDSTYNNFSPQNVTTNRMRALYVNPPNGNVETAITTLRPATRAAGGWHYVMLDINGDGLTDALEIVNQTRPAAGDPPSTEEAISETFRINSGAGFDGAYTGNQIAHTDMRFLANSKEEGGIAVADMNQDGLPDLVLMGQVRHNGATTRTEMRVLKAQNGPDSGATAPHLVAGDPPQLIGGALIPAVLPMDTLQAGPMPARVGDFNGDGLMDILAIPTANNPSKLFHVYIHQGNKADLLQKVTNGFLAELTVTHAPISDPTVYQRGRFGVSVPGTNGEPTWEPNADCRYPLSCATAGLWVVASYKNTADHGIQNALDTHFYQYAEGRTDALRGWLGFAQVVETDQRGGKNVTTYENWIKIGSNYPYAFFPKQQGRIVLDRFQATCDPCNAYQTLTTNTYEYLETTVSNGLKTSRVRLRNTATQNSYMPSLVLGNLDRDLAPLMLQPGGRTDLGLKTTDVTAFTAYDDPVDVSLSMPEEQVTSHFTYFADDPANRLLGRVKRREVTSTAGESTQKGTTDYTYQSGTLWVATVTTEPGGTNDVRSTATYTRGSGGLGQVTSVTVAATSTPEDPVSQDTNGDGLPDPTPIQRGWTATYASLDGVYPATYTRGNLVTTYAYHSGLGVLAQVQDPNGIITSYTYDGFGRKRSESTPKQPLVSYDYMLAPPLTAPVPAAVMDTYNSLGAIYTVQRTEQSGPTGSVTYNLAGHEVLARTTGGDGQPIYQFTDYTNFDGQIASRSLPSRGTNVYLNTFQYDNLNRVTKKTLPDGKASTYAFTPSNRRITVRTTNPRGFFSDVSLDDRSRVRTTTEYTPTGSVVTSYDYGVMGLPSTIFVPPATSPGPINSRASPTMCWVVGSVSPMWMQGIPHDRTTRLAKSFRRWTPRIR